MLNALSLLPFLVIPLLHILVFGIAQRSTSKPLHFHRWITYLNYFNVFISAYGISLLLGSSLRELEIVSWKELGLSIRIDRLNTILLTMISIIGLVVSRFSKSYLDGDPNQLRFLGSITGVIGSIQLFVLSENLLTLFLAWLATSLILQKLLLFHPNREKAQLAAKKKFILARLGDTTLFVSLSLLYLTFQTGDLSTIFEQLQFHEVSNTLTLQAAALLLVITAILKSAQIPFHGWLIELMEAPTPVSALLHAGLINAGPYLIIRFSSLLQLAPSSQTLLFSIGIATAIYGAFVFIYQPSIKNALGYSSVAHMGFTLLLCGMGAYSAALLHLTAHSFYKAHSFLSSGSEIEKSSSRRITHAKKNSWIAVLGFILSLGFFMLIGNLVGTYFNKHPFILSIIYLFICLSVSTMVAKAISLKANFRTYLQIGVLSLLSLISFLIFESFFQQLISSEVIESGKVTFLIYYSALGMLLVFTVLILINSIFSKQLFQNLRYQLTIHLRNGLYINLFINRLIGAHKK